MAEFTGGFVFRSSSLSEDHFAGCDEALREIESEPMSNEEALSITNECRREHGLPPITWEELKGESNSVQS